MKIIKAKLKYCYSLIPLELKKLDGIVLHHAMAKNCTPEDIHRWHLNKGWNGAGYNYFVDKQGQIFELRGMNQGAHCKGHNPHTIGICAEGDYRSDKMPMVQKTAIIELCKHLIDKYPQIKKIYKHSELFSTDCPSKNYPFDEIINEIFYNKDNYSIIKETQLLLNRLGFKDYENKVLVADGVSGKRTESAREKAKSVLKYVLE